MERIKYEDNNIEEVIKKSVEVLKKGGTVIYPTETCYGIAVDATNQKAVDRLYEYKGFRGQKPFSMAVIDREMAEQYVEINEMADNLYKNYLPGPVTVVSKSKGGVAKGVESEFGSIGIRIPDHKVPVEIVKLFGKPITATSANVSYKPVPYSIEQYLKLTPKKSLKYIDLIIDAGKLPPNVPSTVLDTTMNSLSVLREGKLEFEQAIKKSKLYMETTTKSADQTTKLAYEIAEHFTLNQTNGPLVFALSGELGAGKTQFAKGIGSYLKVEDTVNSPTYTIINEYQYSDRGNIRKLAHMDTWRLQDENEFARSGLQEYLLESDIVVVEWADKYYTQLESMVKQYGGKLVQINFKYLSQKQRSISIYETL